MQLCFLGTGAAEGMPGLFCQCDCCKRAREQKGRELRRRACALVDDALLIDFPPDIYAASQYGEALTQVEHVLITHQHREHFYTGDLCNLREPYSLGRPPLHLYGSAEVLQRLRSSLGDALSYIGDRLVLHELSVGQQVDVGGYAVTPLEARHCEGALLFLIQKEGKALLYGLDSGFFPESTWDALRGIQINLAVLDCCNVTEHETKTHMNIEDNITVAHRLFAQRSTGEQTTFVASHFSHMAGLTHLEIEERLRLHGIKAAYDGMTVTL